jgi:magnesium transporter
MRACCCLYRSYVAILPEPPTGYTIALPQIMPSRARYDHKPQYCYSTTIAANTDFASTAGAAGAGTGGLTESPSPMLRAFAPDRDMVITEFEAAAGVLPSGAVWIDMHNPSREEELFIERATGIAVPTREEMDEIETSSRLYEENGAVYMTVTLATGIMRENAESHAVSFILSPAHLVTLRYAPILSFDRFASHVERSPVLCESASMALVHLLDAVVDRLADGIEHVGRDVDAISRQAFRRARGTAQQRVSNLALQLLLVRLGSAQDALSKARNSAVSLSRALSFLAFAAPKSANIGPHVKGLSRDLASLTDHASYLGNNITFLLDASLGLISIEQNAVLKIFSVAAIVFMPPTLIAGIYGMNFARMPELQWALGYPWALALMLLSAILPYLFFRWRGWL